MKTKNTTNVIIAVLLFLILAVNAVSLFVDLVTYGHIK
jgi:hypothetical protein